VKSLFFQILNRSNSVRAFALNFLLLRRTQRIEIRRRLQEGINAGEIGRDSMRRRRSGISTMPLLRAAPLRATAPRQPKLATSSFIECVFIEGSEAYLIHLNSTEMDAAIYAYSIAICRHRAADGRIEGVRHDELRRCC
jgi:hypothetical protein